MFGTKTLRRGTTFLAAAALLAMPIGMTTANAEPDYPPTFYKISAKSYTTTIGRSIVFKAQTFQSGSAIAVDVSVDGSSVGTSTAKANGKGVVTKSVKFTVLGVNRVTMSGTSDTGEDLALSADVTVTAKGEAVPVDNGGDGGNSDNLDNGTGGSGDDATNGADAAGGIPFLGGGLPRTGGEIAGTVLVAAILLAAGALLVIATRRRRSSH